MTEWAPDKTCKDIVRKLLYLYPHLSKQEQTEIDEHVAECPTCKDLLATKGSISPLLDELPPV